MRRIALTLAVAALGKATAAPARADVLVNAPVPLTKACGASIEVGVWYQAFSGGPRWATISIRTLSGARVFHREATATTHWRFWRYHPGCGRRYVVRYVTPQGPATFRVRIRPA